MSPARPRWLLSLLLLPLTLALMSPAPTDAATRKAQKKPVASQAKAKPAAKPTAKPAAKPVGKAEQLQRLYADYWEQSLQLNPLQATFQGDPRWNDQLPNYLSAEFRQRNRDFTAQWLAKVEAIGEDGLAGQDLLSYRIFVRNARDALESERYPAWMQPINQFNSPATLVAMLGSGSSAQPFKTVQDYDNWLRRAGQVPALFDQAVANMEQGMAAGVVQPRPLMEKVLPQLDALIRPSADAGLLPGCTVVRGAFPDALPAAMSGIDAVVSCLASRTGAGPRRARPITVANSAPARNRNGTIPTCNSSRIQKFSMSFRVVVRLSRSSAQSMRAGPMPPNTSSGLGKSKIWKASRRDCALVSQ